MDIWHKIGRIVRLSNLGTLIFFLLNFGLLFGAFFTDINNWQSAVAIVVFYLLTVAISLSPVGEFLLAALAGARRIKRRDIKIRLIPLLEVVLSQALNETPTMVKSINLKIVNDKSPNAFAVGRKTICVTEGLLNLSDEEIMAIFAHELGHFAYKHTTIQLLIGGGNLFISGTLLLIKLVCWAISAVFALIALSSRRLFFGMIIAAIGSIYSIAMWLWTKFCMLFLMWSMRQNEFVADEYAYKLGYGNTLAHLLDTSLITNPSGGFFKAIFASHPNSDERIAKLQELGCTYGRY